MIAPDDVETYRAAPPDALPLRVMAGLDPATQRAAIAAPNEKADAIKKNCVLMESLARSRGWVAGSSPAMTLRSMFAKNQPQTRTPIARREKKMRHGAWVYIMASKRNGTLYCGVTNDVGGRIWAHKQGTGSKFCKKYKVHLLVWYEHFDFIAAAIQRETNIKKWPRKWKLDLIESMNPEWQDL